MVRSNDREAFHCVITALQLGLNHGLDTGIATLRREPELSAGCLTIVSIAAERAADQVDTPVERGRHAVHRADKGSLTPASHAHF